MQRETPFPCHEQMPTYVKRLILLYIWFMSGFRIKCKLRHLKYIDVINWKLNTSPRESGTSIIRHLQWKIQRLTNNGWKENLQSDTSFASSITKLFAGIKIFNPEIKAKESQRGKTIEKETEPIALNYTNNSVCMLLLYIFDHISMSLFDLSGI